MNDNLIKTFIINNQLNLSTLLLGTKPYEDFDNKIRTDYYLKLYPNLRTIRDLTIILKIQNKKAMNNEIQLMSLHDIKD